MYTRTTQTLGCRIYLNRVGVDDQQEILKLRPLKEIDRDTLAFRGPALWNALPDGVKLSARKGIFKSNIKNGRTINDISFNKGTVFNTNKRKDYIYY